jgi:hypothetical protein
MGIFTEKDTIVATGNLYLMGLFKVKGYIRLLKKAEKCGQFR